MTNKRCTARGSLTRLGAVLDRRSSADFTGRHVTASRVETVVRLLQRNGKLTEKLDLRGATVEGCLTLAQLHLEAPVCLEGATLGGLELRELTGLGHITFGADQTRIGLLHVECRGEHEVLELQNVRIDRTVRVEDSHLRRLSFSESYLGEDVRLKRVDLRVLSVRESDFKQLRALDVDVEARVTLRDCYAERLECFNFNIDGFLDISSCGAIDLYRGSVAGPARLVWRSPDKAGAGNATPFKPRDQKSTKLEAKLVQFGSTAQLRWCGGDVDLSESSFAAASTLDAAEKASSPPRLTGVEGVAGEALRIRRVDLKSCHLAEAATLGPITADHLKAGFGARGWTWRRRIADEGSRERWRRHSDRRRRARRLAATYRDLRISSEAAGEHAGANDLHYGERLWQRKAAKVGSLQWLWLTAYGLVGYGVRPWRPFAWLVVVVLASAIALEADGRLEREQVVAGDASTEITELCSEPEPARTPAEAQRVACDAKFSDGLEFVARAATSIGRPVPGFTTQGAWAVVIELATRLLAALLIGLFLLSMRNRVRR